MPSDDEARRARRVIFADSLRRTMREEGVTVRGLARRVAAQSEAEVDPDAVERSLYKWLAAEHLPSRRSREALARALERPPGFFDPRGVWTTQDFRRTMVRSFDRWLSYEQMRGAA